MRIRIPLAGAALLASSAALHVASASAQASPLPSAAQRDSATADSVHRLSAVTVVAAPPDRRAPLGATHVGTAVIRQTPSQTPYDLLRLTAGVEVHEQGQGPGFASDASLRGFSSDHSTDLALWVDGVPINEPVNGHAEGYNDWAVLFPGGIQDIDVIRGPTDARFGNFGLAGVVNVRTVERMRGSELSLTGGSYGRADGMLLTGFDHGTRGGGVAGLRFSREDGFRPNARYGVGQGHARLVRNLAPNVTLDGGVELYGGDWRSPGFLGEDEFVRQDYAIVSNPSDGGYKRRAQERVSLRVLAGSALWRSTVYATQGRWQLFLTIPPAGGRFEGSGSQTEEEDRRSGYGATSAITWALPRGEVTVGGEGRGDRSDYENYFTTDRARDSVATLVSARQVAGGLFVQSHADVTTRLRVDIGARYDALGTRSTPEGESLATASHAVLSPKVGALLRLAPAVGVYANYSRGFRSTDGVISNPALAPITARAYETGVKIDHGLATASVALFRVDVSNEQTFNPVTLSSSNGGASRRQGLEIDWRTPLTRVAVLSGNWTFNDARYRSAALADEGGGPVVVLDGLRVYNTSKYVGSSAVDAGLVGARWRIHVAGNWVGPYSPFDEPGVVLGGYGLAHASATMRWTRVEVDAGVRNVFSRAYPEVVAGHIVSPGQPRAFVVSTRVRF